MSSQSGTWQRRRWATAAAAPAGRPDSRRRRATGRPTREPRSAWPLRTSTEKCGLERHHRRHEGRGSGCGRGPGPSARGVRPGCGTLPGRPHHDRSGSIRAARGRSKLPSVPPLKSVSSDRHFYLRELRRHRGHLRRSVSRSIFFAALNDTMPRVEPSSHRSRLFFESSLERAAGRGAKSLF